MAPVTPGPPAATTLTVVASPTSVLHGGTVQLSGRLQHANATKSIAGETLTLERQPKGTTSWTSLATVTTASGGTLDPTQAVTPQAHTDYRLLHPATPFYAASTSQAVRVRVGVRLTARRNRPSMALGRTATISGQVTPPHRGQPIRLQQKRDGPGTPPRRRPSEPAGATASGCAPRPPGRTGGASIRPATPTTSGTTGGLPGGDHRHPRRRRRG